MTEEEKTNLSLLREAQEATIPKVETSSKKIENPHFNKVFTSNVDTIFKSVSYTKEKQKAQKLTEKEQGKKTELEKIKGVSYDDMTNKLTIEKKGLVISIENFNEPSFSGLSLSTTKTLDRIKTEYTRTGNSNIRLHISQFANRGIKDKRKLKETINKDISNLYLVSLAYNDTAKKNPKNLKLTRIIDSGNIKISTKNGLHFSFFQGDYLVITLAKGYTTFLDKNAISYVDDRAYIMDNANAYAIYARIIGQHNMNQGSIRAFVIPNSSLIEACPKVPSIEQLKLTGDRHIEKRRVEVVKNSLIYIKETIPGFSYVPCTKQGEPLTDEEKEIILSSEKKYSKGYTRVFIEDYPFDKGKIKKNTEKRESKSPKKPRTKKVEPHKNGV